MKTDHLEKFVSENRAAFDDARPPADLWKKIDRPKARVISLTWKQVAWRAAAVVIIFSASWFTHDLVNREENGVAEIAGTEEEEKSPLFIEFVEAEAFYTAQIDLRKEQVFTLAKEDPELVNEIDTELFELDQVYEELKNDLNDNADNEQVIEALIQNYRLKLEILEEMLYLLQKSQSNEKQKNHENTGLKI